MCTLLAPSLASVVSTVRQSGNEDSPDGFTDKVNDGTGIFRPIRPGAHVPAANQFAIKKSTNDGTNSDDTTTDASASPEPEDVCFPGVATVELDDGRSKKMADLQVGDVVRVSHDSYSPVFMFTHRLTSIMYRHFVQLRTASGHDITLTPSHYLYVMSSKNDDKQLVTAGSVNVGDLLILNNDQTSNVVEVNRDVSLQGLYNPQTVHGDIVVDDIIASTYTKSVQVNTAHALLSPLRMLYERIGLSFTCFNAGAGQLTSLVPSGSDLV